MAPDRARDAGDSFHHDSFHHASFHRDQDARHATATWSDWSCTVRVVVADPSALSGAVAVVKSRMAQVERVASRFVIDSDLNWANANSGRPVAVSALLIELVNAALDGARRSAGALDPTVGRHLAAIGYDRDILLVADEPAAAGPATDEHAAQGPSSIEPAAGPTTDGPAAGAKASAVGARASAAGADRAEVTEEAGPSGRTWRDVTVDRDLGLLTVPRGTALDLGATAKAQTADWAAYAVHSRFATAVLVEIGGDLAVAGGPPPEGDWQLTVAERAGAAGQQISVRRGGVATSTTTVRTWHRGGVRVHHIIDPRTGRPTDGPWRTVSVAAESAVQANVCSTASIVLGDRALDWLVGQGVAARLVDGQGRVTTLGGWPIEPVAGVTAAAGPSDVAAAADLSGVADTGTGTDRRTALRFSGAAAGGAAVDSRESPGAR